MVLLQFYFDPLQMNEGKQLTEDYRNAMTIAQIKKNHTFLVAFVNICVWDAVYNIVFFQNIFI